MELNRIGMIKRFVGADVEFRFQRELCEGPW